MVILFIVMLNWLRAFLKNNLMFSMIRKRLFCISSCRLKNAAFPILIFFCVLNPVSGLATTTLDWIQIEKLLQSKQTSVAKNQLKDILKARPNDPLAELLLAQAYAQENNSGAAISIYQRIAKQDNTPLVAINNLAALYAKQGNITKALLLLQQGIKNDPYFSILSENINHIYGIQASNAYKKALAKPNKAPDQTNSSINLELMTVNIPEYINPPQAKKPERKPSNNALLERDVMRTIDSWAKAWSTQNVEKYLTFYHQDFQLPRNISRKNWNAFRKKRLQIPRSISVIIKNPVLLTASDQNMAVIEFTQNYRSNTFRETSQKLLILKKTRNRWKIIREYLAN